MDRFGRVVDQRWVNTTTGAATDRFQYGYDADGNRLWRDNLVNSAFGELYAYDNLNQLTSFQRGTLNPTHTGLTGSASAAQSWSPDAVGNFASVTTNGTTQTRSHNAQNEITGISSATTPAYDSAGNLTTDETGKQQGPTPPDPKRLEDQLKAVQHFVDCLDEAVAGAILQSMRFVEPHPDAMRRPCFPGQTTLGDRGENLSAVFAGYL